MLFWKIINNGGPIMVIIAFFGVVATFIFLEKWFHFHREQVNVKELITGLFNVLKRNGIVEAITLCDNTPGPVAHVLMAAILSFERDEKGEELRRAVEDASLLEVPRLERGLNVLATIAYVAPLLGLLGTVIGMIGAFEKIQAKGALVNATDLTGDIGMALFTTAGGLCVAIPCYIAYNYLISRIESMTLDMEKASSEILYFFKVQEKTQESKDGKTGKN